MMPAIRLVCLLVMPTGVFACIQGTSLPKVRPAIADFVAPPPKVVTEIPDHAFPPTKVVPAPAQADAAQINIEVPAIRLPVPAVKADRVLSEQQAQEVYKKVVADYERLPAGTATPASTNDYAASLMFLRQPAKAVAVLVALERDHPGDYATAANLGTAYELSGDVPNALKWIREGVTRNSVSHQGTEWLHVAILETKLKLQGDPGWLRSASVLDAAASRPAAETLRAIEYQLNERLRFIKSKDPVVCDLFYQAALRVSGPEAERRRAYYFKQSRHFGDLHQRDIQAFAKI